MVAMISQLLTYSMAEMNLENIMQRQDTKGYIPHESIHTKYPAKAIHRYRRRDVIPRAWGGTSVSDSQGGADFVDKVVLHWAVLCIQQVLCRRRTNV